MLRALPAEASATALVLSAPVLGVPSLFRTATNVVSIANCRETRQTIGNDFQSSAIQGGGKQKIRVPDHGHWCGPAQPPRQTLAAALSKKEKESLTGSTNERAADMREHTHAGRRKMDMWPLMLSSCEAEVVNWLTGPLPPPLLPPPPHFPRDFGPGFGSLKPRGCAPPVRARDSTRVFLMGPNAF